MELQSLTNTNIGNLMIFAGLGLFVIAVLFKLLTPSHKLICRNCGAVNEIRTEKRGKTSVETMLWVIFLIPGPIYSIWRVIDKRKFCAKCDSQNLIRLDSAEGLKKWEEMKKSESK